MRIEEVVGQNVARLRNTWGLSQVELGQKIGQECGKTWSRQTVSAAEQGGRAFTVSDLVMLAYVFQVSSDALLHLPPLVQTFEVGGKAYRREDLAPISWQSAPTRNGISAVSEELRGLGHELEDLTRLASDVGARTNTLYAASLRLRSQQHLEALGAARPEDYEFDRFGFGQPENGDSHE
ncbi:MAG: helix-turn-helix transcriptional regulator [Dermatophilaceae bacterium]